MKSDLRTGFALLCALLALPAGAQTPKLDCTVSWFGNSYNGKSRWTLQDVADLCVLPDGTLFTNVFWDEGGANVQEYRAGDVVAVAGHTHGWGYDGGAAVAANAKCLFIAQRVGSEGGGLKGESWPPKGFRWNGNLPPPSQRYPNGGSLRGRPGGRGRHAPGSLSADHRSSRGR